MNSSFSQQPSVPLESLGPLKPVYLAITQVLEEILGLNTAILINAGFIIAALSTAFHYAGKKIYRYAQHMFLSSVHLNEDSELYAYVMRWMADYQLSSQSFRKAKAVITKSSSWEEEDAASKLLGNVDFQADRLVSYRSLLGRRPIRLQPFEGWHLFRHRGHWIYFSHKVHQSSSLFSDPRERGYIHLEVLGWSLAPIEALLRDTQTYHLARSMSSTHVFRAIAARGDSMSWTRVASRPARDIRTVVLDQATKQRLLRDINEYLHPRTRQWYANHGVPYRRGYLFSGSPGSGKTSLTAAIAGVFGLDIYVLSLLDPSLTESQLMRLFSEIPGRCIVLLEDIDVAGLSQRSDGPRSQPPRSPTELAVEGIEGLKSPTDIGSGAAKKTATNAGVSLSALLNAIDGVSSSEGRVLIMTTNAPETLDRALVRPGRVDMHVAFNLPTRTEMEELFVSMYFNPDSKKKDIVNEALDIKRSKAADISELTLPHDPALREMAQRFAEALPEKRLSLASIQGFLLGFKSNPEGACQNVKEWAQKMIQEQESDEQDRSNTPSEVVVSEIDSRDYGA